MLDFVLKPGIFNYFDFQHVENYVKTKNLSKPTVSAYKHNGFWKCMML